MNNLCYILPPWLAIDEIRCRWASNVILDILQLIQFWGGLIPDPDKNWLPWGGPQENPDKTSPKAPKNRPDKNSGFGPLQDQGVQGIIGGPTQDHSSQN